MHIDDGTLRAYADGALAAAERERVAGHLAGCEACRGRGEELNAQGERVAARLAALSPAVQPADAHAALNHFRRRREFEGKEPVVFKQLLSQRFRIVWVGAAAILLAFVAFSFEPVQAWAGQFLSLFRVEQVAVLPVDTTGLSALSGNSALANQISQMMTKSVKVTKKPGSPQVVDTAPNASKLAGFDVRLPSSRTDKPQLTVLGGAAFQAVADRAKAQAILNETGHSNLVLPDSLDGATFKVDIPASVNAGYGSCPKISTEGKTVEGGSTGRRMQDCVMLVEMPSPTVDTPPNVDLKQLAQIGLQFTGMTAQQAKEYSDTVDWTSTLVIPVPRNGASYEKVNVDGVTGYLIQRPVDDVPGYALVWVKDGIIYAISGMTNDTATALQMANSLK